MRVALRFAVVALFLALPAWAADDTVPTEAQWGQASSVIISPGPAGVPNCDTNPAYDCKIGGNLSEAIIRFADPTDGGIEKYYQYYSCSPARRDAAHFGAPDDGPSERSACLATCVVGLDCTVKANWVKYAGNPVFDGADYHEKTSGCTGGGNNEEGVFSVAPIVDGSTIHMYLGVDQALSGTSCIDVGADLRYASSTDGYTFTNDVKILDGEACNLPATGAQGDPCDNNQDELWPVAAYKVGTNYYVVVGGDVWGYDLIWSNTPNFGAGADVDGTTHWLTAASSHARWFSASVVDKGDNLELFAWKDLRYIDDDDYCESVEDPITAFTQYSVHHWPISSAAPTVLQTEGTAYTGFTEQTTGTIYRDGVNGKWLFAHQDSCPGPWYYGESPDIAATHHVDSREGSDIAIKEWQGTADPFVGSCTPSSLTPGNWCQMASSDLSTFVNSTLETDNPNTAPYRYTMESRDPQTCIEGNDSLAKVYTGWSGGVWDGNRQELAIFGGGHSDGCDNSIYAFNIDRGEWRLVTTASSSAFRRYNATPEDTRAADGSGNRDGTPLAAHTYDMLEYVPTLGSMCAFGVKVAYSSDGNSCDRRIYCNDMEQRGYGKTRGWWVAGTRIRQPGQNVGDSTGYDRRYGRLWNHNMNQNSGKPTCDSQPHAQAVPTYWDGWDETDPGATEVVTGDSTSGTSAFNPVNQHFYRFGGGLWDSPNASHTMWDVSVTPPVKTNVATTLSYPVARTGPGAAWDQHDQRIVTWNGGSNLYVLDDTSGSVGSWSWATCSMIGGGPTGQTNGDYGRFQYSHKHNVFVVTDSATNDVWIGKLPLSPGCGTAQSDMDIRPEPLAAERPGYKSLYPYFVYGGDSNRDAVVTARYRTSAGPGSWINHVMYLAETGLDVGEPDGIKLESNRWATVITDLQPNTKYDIEVTIADPDGYSEVMQITSKTKSLPADCGAATATPGTTVAAQAAINAAVAGDVIELQAGTYLPAGGNPYVLNISSVQGDLGNRICIRGADRDTTILDANGQVNVIYANNSIEHLVIENMTLQGTVADASGEDDEAALYTASDRMIANDVVVRDLLIANSQNGGIAVGKFGQGRDNWVYDNRMTGNVVHPEYRNADDVGIIVPGRGNVVFNNTINNMGEGFKLFDPSAAGAPWPGDNTPHRATEMFLNDIDVYADDCVEFDRSQGMTIFRDNRCTNGTNCLSAQPGYAGPIIFLRNVCWNAQGGSPLKINVDNRVAQGAIAYNNVWRIPWVASSAACVNYHIDIRNNLLVGPLNPVDRRGNNVFEGSADFCELGDLVPRSGACNSGDCDSGYGTMDHNGYSTQNGGFQVNEKSFATLAAMAAGPEGWGVGSIVLGGTSTPADVWADTSIFQQNTDTCSETCSGGCTSLQSCCGCNPPGGWLYHTPPDMRLKAGVNAIDAGVVIGDFNRGYSGVGPDLGPIEFGAALPAYGVTWDIVIPPTPAAAPAVQGIRLDGAKSR